MDRVDALLSQHFAQYRAVAARDSYTEAQRGAHLESLESRQDDIGRAIAAAQADLARAERVARAITTLTQDHLMHATIVTNGPPDPQAS